MKNKLRRFFEKEKIEYFSVLPYSQCRIIRPDIMEREAFEPKCVIVFLVPYYSGECVNISRYAASRDYHIYLDSITERLSQILEGEALGVKFKGYGDHSPIDERDAAAKCSLGVIGDNGLLINEKYGSYVFIGELICDIEPDLLALTSVGSVKFCEHCGACRLACPTGRLTDPEQPCLSAITQKRGSLTDPEKELIKKTGTVWGCDACQEACPHNENPKTTPIKFFCEDRITNLTSEILADLSDGEFSSRAFSWRGRKTLLRNLDIYEK